MLSYIKEYYKTDPKEALLDQNLPQQKPNNRKIWKKPQRPQTVRGRSRPRTDPQTIQKRHRKLRVKGTARVDMRAKYEKKTSENQRKVRVLEKAEVIEVEVPSEGSEDHFRTFVAEKP